MTRDKIILEKWLSKNYNGEMNYLNNHLAKRENPTLLVKNAKTVISLITYYNTKQKQKNNTQKIAKFAFYEDYHYSIKVKMRELTEFMQKKIPSMKNCRSFVDTAPIFERAWAVKAGLGWIGKNNLFISPKFGSFVLLSEIIVDIELEYAKTNEKNHCKDCKKCINACPTKALEKEYCLNANNCIAYQTIEKKTEIDKNIQKYNWVFGCDICQDICPWNKTKKQEESKILKLRNEFSVKLKNLK